ANRQLIAPLPGGQACLPRAPGRRFPRPVRVTSVGNRQRPHHGGTHARRVRGTPTCHHPPHPRPPCQVHLPGPRPIRVLVPQVVAPPPPGRLRGPLCPDARPPPRPPAHPPRVGAGHPPHPPPAAGPRHAGHPLQPHRGRRHPGRAEGPERPPAALRAHHRARPAAPRPDRAPRPPGPSATTAALPPTPPPPPPPPPHPHPRR